MNLRKNIFMALFTVTSVLVIMELLLRLFGLGARVGKQNLDFVPRRANPPYHFNKELGWDLLPNWEGTVKSVHVKTNAFGMRDDPFPLEKPAYTIRILALGDSFTFGFKVADDSCYVEVLERLLNSKGPRPRYEVLNGGVGGYNTEQEKRWLITKGLAFHPDIILVGFVLNDVIYRGIYTPETKSWATRLLYRTAIYNTMERAILSNRAKTDAIERARLTTRRLLEDSDEINSLWQSCFKEISEMNLIATERGIPLVFVLFPWPNEVDSPEGSHVPQERLIRFLRDQDIRYIDLLPAFRLEHDGLFLPEESHPSARGHKVAAREIYSYLTEDVLGRPPFATE
jgi:lysophospholipase L1-like esterase